jgi:hypothetical protein
LFPIKVLLPEKTFFLHYDDFGTDYLFIRLQGEYMRPVSVICYDSKDGLVSKIKRNDTLSDFLIRAVENEKKINIFAC